MNPKPANNPDVLFDMGKTDKRVRAPAAPLVQAGKDKTFRRYVPVQGFLLRPSLDDWLPQNHVARFISEVVDELLDLSELYASYEEPGGAPPYDPRMLLKVLLYGYSVGVTSSRPLERSCIDDVACRYPAANQAPDFRSIARPRRRHLKALEGLFTQVLAGCAMAGLVEVSGGHGRLELRRLQDSSALNQYLAGPDALSPFPHVGQVLRISREVFALDGTPVSRETAYGVTSLTAERAGPARLMRLVRGHWKIENRLHWVRDVSTGEDGSQIRTRSSPHAMASLRNLAIGALRLAGEDDIARGRRWAGRDPARAPRLLGL